MNRRDFLLSTAFYLIAEKAKAFGKFGSMGVVNRLRSILPSSMAAIPPDIYVNFKTNRAQYKNGNKVQASSLVNVVRSSAATQVDSNGNWSQVASNTLAQSNLGASIWEARTNSIRNNIMAGAVVMADRVELTTNGNFAAQGAGWTVGTAGGGSVAFSTGLVSMVGDGSTTNNYIAQRITGLTVGRNYVLLAGGGGNGNGVFVYVGNSAHDGTLVNGSVIVPNGFGSTGTSDRVGFTATATSHWITVAVQIASASTFGFFSVQDGERCQNGGFTANPVNASQSTVQNGWQWTNSTGTGTVVYNSGPKTVTITGDGAHLAGFSVAVPTVAGFTYTISVDVPSATGGMYVGAGAAAYNNNLFSSPLGAGAGQKFQFTASGTTTYLNFSTTPALANTISNVSVQSAGALPTNWVDVSNLGGELTRQVIGIGTENGVNYVDIRWFGTVTAGRTATIYFDATNQAAATYGQTWTAAAFFKLIAGGFSGFGYGYFGFDTYTAGNSYSASFGVGILSISGASLSSQRYSASATPVLSATGFAAAVMSFQTPSSGAVDFTIRIGWPQLENNSLINSTVASAATAASGASGVNGSGVYQVGGGTGTAATLNCTWASGVLTVNNVASAGSYTVFPPSPAALTYVSGTATGWTGATVNLTPTDNSAQAAASNPILTSGAAATRNAETDTLVLTGLPSFGIAYTLWARGTPQAPTGYPVNQNLIQSDTASDAQRVVVRRIASSGQALFISVGGTGWSTTKATTFANGTSTKWAFAVAANDQQAYFDASAGTAQTAVTLPTMPTTVHLGTNATPGEYWNGNLEEIAIWFTQRLPNATLQAITT